MDIRTLGIDLAKNLFRVHGVDARGKTVVQRQLRRRQLFSFMAQSGAVWWERKPAVEHTIGDVSPRKLGHEVRLMSPRFLHPYVKSNKNDARDAEAICEAVARPSMRFVTVKSQPQQDC